MATALLTPPDLASLPPTIQAEVLDRMRRYGISTTALARACQCHRVTLARFLTGQDTSLRLLQALDAWLRNADYWAAQDLIYRTHQPHA